MVEIFWNKVSQRNKFQLDLDDSTKYTKYNVVHMPENKSITSHTKNMKIWTIFHILHIPNGLKSKMLWQIYHYSSIGARAGHQRPQPLSTLDIIGFGIPIGAGTWQVTMTVSEGGVVTLFQIITVGVKWNDLTISWTLGWTLVHSSSTVDVGLSGVRLWGSDK